MIKSDEAFVPQLYDRDDLVQMVEILQCISDDLEDNLLFFDMDTEKQKVFEISKNLINKVIQLIINYNERTKIKYKEI